MSELRDAAHAYAANGYLVLPLHSPTDGRCSCPHTDCSSPAKHPRIARGLHAATADHAQIRSWWTRWPDANIGIRTGDVSNLVVIDVDPRHGGDTTLRQLSETHPGLADTRTIRTGSGGLHLWYHHPGATIPNSAGRLGPGIDIRGDNGYVVAPPSAHLVGTYLTADDRPIAPLPPALIEAARPHQRTAADAPAVQWDAGRVGAWAQAALQREVALVATATEGTRNTTLVRAAFKLGQLVATNHLPQETVAAALVDASTANGLTLREAVSTTTRGLAAGQHHPRSAATRSL